MENLNFLKGLLSKEATKDHYTQLLEEFHFQESIKSTSQQFLEIIDEIRISKMSKVSQIRRKKQEKGKLLLQTSFCSLQNSRCVPTAEVEKSFKEDDLLLHEIEQSMLKKEVEQLGKENIEIKKVMAEAEAQLQVYLNKDKEINQIWCSSKRSLGAVYTELKSERSALLQMEAKYEKQIEGLNLNKKNIERENKFLAQMFADKDRNIKMMLEGTLSLGLEYDSKKNHDKLEEIYPKREVEEKLRVLFLILQTQSHWSGSDFTLKISQISHEALSKIPSLEYSRFESKLEIMERFVACFEVSSFSELPDRVVQFYQSIRSNINRNEKVANQLNTTSFQLKNQSEELEEMIENLEKSKEKDVLITLAGFQKDNYKIKESIQKICRGIVQLLNRKWSVFLRFKKTLDTLRKIKGGNGQKHEILPIEPMAAPMKKISKEKRKSVAEMKKTRQRKNQLIESTSDFEQRNLLRSNQRSLCCMHFEYVMGRSLEEITVEWYETVGNGREGAKLLDTILTNDLYRIFCSPAYYQPNKGEIDNEVAFIDKVYAHVNNLSDFMNEKLKELIKEMVGDIEKIEEELSQSQKNKEKGRNLSKIGSVEAEQMRYVVESKGYFRRDNFKLMEKLEKMQMKKKGLLIPYRYGVDAEEEMLQAKRTPNLNLLEKRLSKEPGQAVKQGGKTPDSHNFLSSYREKLNKADRKIRDLIKHAENLKSPRKSYRFSVRSRKSARSPSARSAHNSLN